MSVWILLLTVCGAGAFGGFINAWISDNGFLMPRLADDAPNQARIFQPGSLGTVFIGAVAAGISWELYGPLAAAYIFGSSQLPGLTFDLTLSSFVGGVLVGIGGARWLTNEVDKKLLRTAAVQAASKAANPDAAQQIAIASPAEALRLTGRMPR